MQKCELEKEIIINSHRELVKDDKILDSHEGIEVIEKSKICDGCNYKQKCLDTMKQLGMLYTEKEVKKQIKVQKAESIIEMSTMENECFKITYNEGNLFIFDKEKNKNVLTIYADMILADEHMGPHVINDLTRSFGFLLKDA